MAKDLFFKIPSKRNWSRDPQAATPGHSEKIAETRVTIQQKKIVELKTKADKGDKKAQKAWAKVSKKVVKLHLKASKGDLKAAKTLAMLTPTGLFVTQVSDKTMKTTMKGAFVGQTEILGSFVGGDSVTEILGNDQLTEIVTSGGAFVGNDQLAEIITSGWGVSSLTKYAKRGLKTAYKLNPYTGKYSLLSAPVLALKTHRYLMKGDDESGLDEILGSAETIAHDKSLPIDMKISTSLLGGEEIVTSGEFIGEEEAALAAEGGACERAALRRRSVRNA
jgi:hypothetical protein